jgi:O-antigen ligase
MDVFLSGHITFSDYLEIHPTYFSVYLIFIFFFLVEFLRMSNLPLKPREKFGVWAALLFIVGMMLMIRSQMGLLVFAILLVFYGIIILKRRAWLVTLALFTIGLLSYLLDTNRVTTWFDSYGRNVSSALDNRILIWQGTWEGVKSAPIFGAGTGGQQLLINIGYVKLGFTEGIEKSYNAHNQYLQFLARNGFVELACFLLFMTYAFRRSLTMSSHGFMMFNMTVTLIMLVESFLSLQSGIVFFYFFSLAYIFLPYTTGTAEPRTL